MSALKAYQNKIIDLLIQQELLIAELYRFFSSLYPDARDFWNDLSREEMEHATWIEYFHGKAMSAEVAFNEDRIKSYTVESFVNYLQDNLSKVKAKAPTLQAAFSLSLSIENSLLVSKVFDRFESTDMELLMLLRKLRSGMVDHRKRIGQMAARISST